MSFMTGLRAAFAFNQPTGNRPQGPSQQMTPSGYGWQGVTTSDIPDSDTFDNVFPYSNAIAQRFSTIVPYAVDEDGKKIRPTPAPLMALYAPNDMFSCREFLGFIASSMLTQSHLDILIWTRDGKTAQPGGKVTGDNITGYTFLPSDSRVYNPNKTDYTFQAVVVVDGVAETRRFTRDEVISLRYSTHPNDITRGISPAMTVKKWASVDDMIADYERGFFGNGAVPAGMMGIVSETPEDFAKNRAHMEDTFREIWNWY